MRALGVARCTKKRRRDARALRTSGRAEARPRRAPHLGGTAPTPTLTRCKLAPDPSEIARPCPQPRGTPTRDCSITRPSAPTTDLTRGRMGGPYVPRTMGGLRLGALSMMAASIWPSAGEPLLPDFSHTRAHAFCGGRAITTTCHLPRAPHAHTHAHTHARTHTQ